MILHLSKKNKIILYILLFFFGLFFIATLYAYYEAGNLKISRYTYTKADIPTSFNGKKIVFISDIHCNRFFTSKDVAELVEKVNGLAPDIILLGGDYVLKDESIALLFFEQIKKLSAKYGVYSVLGNHDHWENAAMILNGFEKCGFYICDNQSYWIKIGTDSIKIGGVGDLWTDEQLLANTTESLDVNDFCILLSHNPDYIDLIEQDDDATKIDLMLSGHTHAGQITLFGIWAPIMPGDFNSKLTSTSRNYLYGWKRKSGIDLYITSGAGKGSMPFRFFAQPEIVEITLCCDTI